MVTIERDKDVCRLSIDGEMTIYTAAELKGKLLPALQGCTEAELDLSRVAEMDTAGLQLLVLLKREAAAAGGRFRFVSHSKDVLEVLDLCNMVGAFGDPVVISSTAG